MKAIATLFWSNESGQDLTEHGLLLAFVCLISAALLHSGHDSVVRIWAVANDLVATVAKHVVKR